MLSLLHGSLGSADDISFFSAVVAGNEGARFLIRSEIEINF